MKPANKPALADAILVLTLLSQLEKASMYWMAGPWCTEYRGSGVQPTMTCRQYTNYVTRRYGHAIIVFDGYQEELSTK